MGVCVEASFFLFFFSLLPSRVSQSRAFEGRHLGLGVLATVSIADQTLTLLLGDLKDGVLCSAVLATRPSDQSSSGLHLFQVAKLRRRAQRPNFTAQAFENRTLALFLLGKRELGRGFSAAPSVTLISLPEPKLQPESTLRLLLRYGAPASLR